MRDLTKQRIALIATGCIAIGIGYLTLQPLDIELIEVSNMDKVYHFVAFGALILPVAAFFTRALIWVLPAALMYGAAIEVIQPYIGRGGEFLDFVADTVGLFFVIGACWVLRKLMNNNKYETRRSSHG